MCSHLLCHCFTQKSEFVGANVCLNVKCSYLSDKLTWKGLLACTFCHCTHTITVVCVHAWPLCKVCGILHFCPTRTLLRARDGIVRISFSTLKTWLPLANHSLAYANHLI